MVKIINSIIFLNKLDKKEDNMEEINKEEISADEENDKEVENNNTETNPLRIELEETTDRLKRLMAEFDNFKKRSSKEREQLYNSILADIVSSILPVIDNLENAVGADTEDEAYKQGIELVAKQFMDVLSSLGVEVIPSVGTTFNPEYHEAVSSVIDENLGEKEIKEEYRKGYKIKDRVIRHSMVVVAN